jgi:hypothetical protein
MRRLEGGGWSEYQKPIANGDEQKETQSRLVAPPPATTTVRSVKFNADRAAADELAQLKTKLSNSSAANTVTSEHSQSAAGAVSSETHVSPSHVARARAEVGRHVGEDFLPPSPMWTEDAKGLTLEASRCLM